jgi:cytidine deaminase
MNQRQFPYTYQELSEEELSEADRQLWEQAKAARAASYSPYSQFAVGAALLMENGEVVLGTNQENMAYPSGLCAERVALYAAGVRFPSVGIRALAVCAAPAASMQLVGASPCGSCRQVMLEFEHRQQKPFRLLFMHEPGKLIIADSCQSLMPFAFHF